MKPGDSCTVTAPLPYQALPVICTTVTLCVLFVCALVAVHLTQRHYRKVNANT